MSLAKIESVLHAKLDEEVNYWSTYRTEFEVARKLASQNKLKGNTKAGRYAYQQERAWWHKQFSMAVMAKWVTKASKYRIVRVTRIIGKGGKFFDMGNLVGGCKAMLDAMVNTGVLVDDSPTHCFISYKQVRGEIDKVKFEVCE